MEIFPPGRHVDFLKHRKALLGLSAMLVVLSIASLFWPGPRFGIDFRGGTELQLELGDELSLAEVRRALQRVGFAQAQVSADADNPRRFVIRIAPSTESELGNLVRSEGAGDPLIDAIARALGERATPQALRVEWVGPQLGADLRSAAIRALLFAVVLVVLYITFRFDLRFAPGGVIAVAHDALITMGVFVLLRREINLASIAAILVVVGYSLADTMVVYDRIRENIQRMRDKTLYQIINASTSQTMSRTLVMSGTTCLAILGFLIWGTAVVRDLVVALLIGFVVGTYSSIYVASGITEWLDRRVFRRATTPRVSSASTA